jgi:DNA polymerase III epsilon subunit-like protein
MRGIETLVYFDIEATGLKSSGRPRITEISFLAVKMDDTLNLSFEIMQLLKNGHSEGNLLQLESLQPRIVNKLTLCVYPMATIVPHVSDITGLDNYMLNGQSKFEESTGNLLNSFLSHLPSPVCLVAHNGDAYDFPLLKAEMEKVNTPLDPLILCVDSYIGIKNIYKRKQEENAMSIDSDKTATIIQRNLSVAFCKNKITHQPCSGELRSVKKMKISPLCIPSSFSLVNLHNHLLGFPPLKSHGAEADCLTLLRTTAMIGRDWLDWVEENCYFIEGCKAMWQMA